MWCPWLLMSHLIKWSEMDWVNLLRTITSPTRIRTNIWKRIKNIFQVKWILFLYFFILIGSHGVHIIQLLWPKRETPGKDVRPPAIYIITWRSFTCAAQVEIVLSMCVCVEKNVRWPFQQRARHNRKFNSTRAKEEEEVNVEEEGGITLKNKNHHCTRNTVGSSSISLSINHHGLSLKSVLFYKLFSWYLSFSITHSSFYCYILTRRRSRQVIAADHHPRQNLL